jgi:hypothetical protein
MMDINEYLYLPTWEEIEDELQKEVDFMELFNSDKIEEYTIELSYRDSLVELKLDEMLRVLDDDLIYKILEISFNFIKIEIVFKDDLTEEVKDKIYDLRNDIIDLEAYNNIIDIQIKYLNKKAVLEFFSKLYEILH